MALNMDDDLDLSMRAPYISMSEADELPLLIAEDLMWGAQPEGLKEGLRDIKQQISLNLMKDNGSNNMRNGNRNNYSEQSSKSHMESSLAALLCSTLLHHQQQQSSEKLLQNSMSSSSHTRNPEIKIKIVDSNAGDSIHSHSASPVDGFSKGFKNCEYFFCLQIFSIDDVLKIKYIDFIFFSKNMLKKLSNLKFLEF